MDPIQALKDVGVDVDALKAEADRFDGPKQDDVTTQRAYDGWADRFLGPSRMRALASEIIKAAVGETVAQPDPSRVAAEAAKVAASATGVAPVPPKNGAGDGTPATDV